MTDEEKTTETKNEEIAEEAKEDPENTPVEESGKTAEESEQADDGKHADEKVKGEEDKTAEIRKMIEGKNIDKMTVKDLKEVAKEIPDITGVHGMNKPDLIVVIKKYLGIEDARKKKKDVSLIEVKKKIKSLKVMKKEALSANDKKMAKIYKRKISRLKKKTRRAA